MVMHRLTNFNGLPAIYLSRPQPWTISFLISIDHFRFSCRKSLFQSEAMFANKLIITINSLSLGLVLKVRIFGTRKGPIDSVLAQPSFGAKNYLKQILPCPS